MDSLRFQIGELERAELVPGEEEELNARRELLRNGEKYIAALSGADYCLSGDDNGSGAVAAIRDAEEALHGIRNLSADLGELYKRLEALRCEAFDLAEIVRDKRAEFDFSPAELDAAEARTDQLYRLKKKYGATVEDMIAYLNRCRTELDAMETADDTLILLQGKNLWHLSHEGLDLESPANEPQYNKPGFLELGISPEQAPDKPTYVTIHFEKGIPTAVDGKEMGAVELVEHLNKLGGENGIGLLDIVENRLVGMKSRGVYETPGGAILYKAINVLETITLDKESSHFKAQLAQKYADIVYNGQWFTPAARGSGCLCRQSGKDRHRRCEAEALQGQHDQRRRHLSVHPVRRADRFLR